MPFTPFHMGPGLAIKAIAGRHFSLLTYGIAQVAMDIEPLIGLFQGATVLHGRSHSVAGATGIALLVCLLSPPIRRALRRWWNHELPFHRLERFRSPDALSWGAIVTGAFIGTYGHVALDSFMHSDMAPFWPWSAAPAWRGIVSTETLHLFCGVTGLIGVLAGLLQGRRRPAPQSPG